MPRLCCALSETPGFTGAAGVCKAEGETGSTENRVCSLAPVRQDQTAASRSVAVERPPPNAQAVC